MDNRRSLSSEEIGASLIEYGLLIALIAIVAFAAVQVMGVEVSGLYDTIGGAFPESGG